MARRGYVAVKQFTCPNHPGGPATLPADGYDYEPLTLKQAYEPEQVAALRIAVAAARICEFDREAATVEAMFGLCCAGHRWKIVGFRPLTRSELTVASLAALLRPPAIQHPAILLAELARCDVVPLQGSPLPVRIPLVRSEGDTSTDGT